MFKANDPEHKDFAPVRQWIERGPAKFIVGGSNYRTELWKVKSVLPFLAEMERRGKVIKASDASVDADEAAVREIEPPKDFDDPHLVALVRLTGCRLICIRDPRSHRYLRASKFYNSSTDRPKLYTGERNSDLLCERNLAACCKKT